MKDQTRKNQNRRPKEADKNALTSETTECTNTKLGFLHSSSDYHLGVSVIREENNDVTIKDIFIFCICRWKKFFFKRKPGPD